MVHSSQPESFSPDHQVSHAPCIQAIHDLESSLIDRLCGTMKENYDLKLQV